MDTSVFCSSRRRHTRLVSACSSDVCSPDFDDAAVRQEYGRIVVGGGEASGRLHAQIYSPPYLFKGEIGRASCRERVQSLVDDVTTTRNGPGGITEQGAIADSMITQR